jgi:hypothetical protein
MITLGFIFFLLGAIFSVLWLICSVLLTTCIFRAALKKNLCKADEVGVASVGFPLMILFAPFVLIIIGYTALSEMA